MVVERCSIGRIPGIVGSTEKKSYMICLLSMSLKVSFIFVFVCLVMILIRVADNVEGIKL